MELSCVVLPQGTNSSIAGLAWVAAFVNKGRSVEYQHGISREVLFQNFIKNKKHMNFFEED
jgi:hypothetical protein